MQDGAMLHLVRVSLLAALIIPLAGCRGLVPSWDRHDSYRYCVPALEGDLFAPTMDCDAVRLCANEAVLSPALERELMRRHAALGCAPL